MYCTLYRIKHDFLHNVFTMCTMFTRLVCYTMYNTDIDDVCTMWRRCTHVITGNTQFGDDVQDGYMLFYTYNRVYKNLHESVHDLHAFHTVYTNLYTLYNMVHNFKYTMRLIMNCECQIHIFCPINIRDANLFHRMRLAFDD